MENRYQVFDTEDEKLYLGVESHYWKVSDSKKVYKDSLVDSEKVDDSIFLELVRSGEKEVEATLSIGVEEAERFAMALLNLCHTIRK